LERQQTVDLAQYVFVEHRRSLRDQPGNKSANAAATDDVFHMAEQDLVACLRLLRSKQVRLVDDKVERLSASFSINRLEEGDHEAAFRGSAGHLRQIDDAALRHGRGGFADQRTRLLIERKVGMIAAEDHDIELRGRLA